MRNVFILLALLVLAVPAEAKIWKVDYANSKLGFTGGLQGKPFSGVFNAWQAKIDLDPADPKTSKIDVSITTASAKTGDKQRDEALPQKDWFDSAIFAEAEFHTTSIKKIDDTHFEATGPLTIRDKTHDITLPFTLTSEKPGLRFKGETAIDRTQFDVGIGEWTTEEMVAHKVTIAVDLIMN